MELIQLRYFVYVAEQESFSSAALLLDVAQTTVSRQVRALEVELRAHLFHRNGRGARLTPAGRRLLDHARGILRAVDAASQAVREEQTNLRGKVVIGLPPGIGKLLVPPLVRAFAEALPGISLSVVEGLSDRLYDQLLTGRLDFAVTRNPAQSAHIVIEPLLREFIFLVGATPVCGGQTTVPVSTLKGLPLILPSAPHSIRPILDAAMAQIGSPPNVVVEVDAVDSLADLAGSGLGYTLVPEGTVGLFSRTKYLSCQQVEGPGFFISLCLVAPSREPLSQVPVESLRLTRQVLTRVFELPRPSQS